ncbi:MAG: ClpP-like prohead protease/major capsid protein fusion protein [Comamonas sp.]
MPTPQNPQSAPKWYEIKPVAAAEETGTTSAEIYIYGNIGDRWNEDGVVAATLVREIAALEVDAIDLRINSYGGSVTDGIAIYNALRRHSATVTSYVDGVALSIASLIAMAGDTIVMAANAQMMIHAPWSVAVGNSQEMRREADNLDRFAKAMASAYTEKSGKATDDVLALLTDGKDHWYLADEAVAEGFADQVGEELALAAALASSFDLSRFGASRSHLAAAAHLAPRGASPTAAAAALQKESSMPEANTPAAAPAAPHARTKADNDQVLAIFKPFAARAEIMALQTEVLADPSLTMEQIQARLLAEIGKGAEPANPQNAHPRVQTVSDEDDKARAAKVNAMLVKSGVIQNAEQRRAMQAGNPAMSLSLVDLARASLVRAGIKTDHMDKMAMVAAAFTQSTSDFPIILESAMHKALQAAYDAAPLTWSRFCATGTVSDFRAHNRYRLGSFGNIDAINELGEFVNKAIPDGEKASIQVGTKGNIINLSRQAIVNDDLGAFIGLASNLGRAAARTVEADVFAMLALNSGLGPVMADTKTLFHADHGNIGTTGAMSVTTIDEGRTKLASQKDVSGNDYLDLRPAVLLCAIGQGGQARVINGAEYDPDTANKLQKPNMVRGLFADVVDTPRLSGTRFYMFADPAVAPTFEVAFLEGRQDPYLERIEGFDVDGSRFKVRLDYGVAAIDYRGAVTNAGA